MGISTAVDIPPPPSPPYTTVVEIASPPPPPPSCYLDEKWKLSKKEVISRSCLHSSSSSTSTSPSSTSSFVKHSSPKRCAFSRKCCRLVQEQRARFYIMRRCVTMLICWHEYSDS